MATCRRCGKELTAASETSAIGETPASWRAERMLRFIFFPARRWIVFSGLIATYAQLAFLVAAILAVGAGIVWLVFLANWSYLLEQNLALLVIAFVILVIGVFTVLAMRILEATRATHYCSSCLDHLIAQKTRRPEELGPHKVKTKKT